MYATEVQTCSAADIKHHPAIPRGYKHQMLGDGACTLAVLHSIWGAARLEAGTRAKATISYNCKPVPLCQQARLCKSLIHSIQNLRDILTAALPVLAATM